MRLYDEGGAMIGTAHPKIDHGQEARAILQSIGSDWGLSRPERLALAQVHATLALQEAAQRMVGLRKAGKPRPVTGRGGDR